MSLQIVKTTETQVNPVFLKILEDIVGGISFTVADLKTVTTEVKAGAVVGEDGSTAGKWHLIKTAKLQAKANANVTSIRVEKNHEFKVGEFITNRQVSTEITGITITETDYDTIALTATLDAIAEIPVGTVLYQGSSETSNTATASTAQVIDDTTEKLDISNPRGINRCKITIEQNSGDTLVISATDGNLLIKLADTTAASNNVAAIQTAVRALGIVGNTNFTDWTFTSDGWDGNVTGSVLTTAVDYLDGGIEKPGQLASLYNAEAVIRNDIDVSGTLPNVSVGAVIRGTVKESLLPFAVTNAIKTLLKNIRFE